jgi:hypothetical protein
MKNYKVTYAVDSLDTNPIIKVFDCSYEAENTKRITEIIFYLQLLKMERVKILIMIMIK